MTVNHHPPPAESIPFFTPVPRRHNRHDGWTATRQRGFIEALAARGSVRAAALSVGMTPEGAYALRRSPGAEEFRTAWDAALDCGVRRLADIAFERATEGVTVPLFYRGEQVGERRWYNDRLLLFLLKHHFPGKYGEVSRPGRFPTRAQLEDEKEGPTDEDVANAHASIARKIWLSRARLLRLIKREPLRRAAWDVLCGPTRWEVETNGAAPEGDTLPNLTQVENLLPALFGIKTLAAPQLGGPFGDTPVGDFPPNMDWDDPAQATAAWGEVEATFRDKLIADGWRQTSTGNWVSESCDDDGDPIVPPE